MLSDRRLRQASLVPVYGDSLSHSSTTRETEFPGTLSPADADPLESGLDPSLRKSFGTDGVIGLRQDSSTSHTSFEGAVETLTEVLDEEGEEPKPISDQTEAYQSALRRLSLGNVSDGISMSE